MPVLCQTIDLGQPSDSAGGTLKRYLTNEAKAGNCKFVYFAIIVKRCKLSENALAVTAYICAYDTTLFGTALVLGSASSLSYLPFGHFSHSTDNIY